VDSCANKKPQIVVGGVSEREHEITENLEILNQFESQDAQLVVDICGIGEEIHKERAEFVM